jgi:uncharacterized protein YndB with AHSA1/START domain
VLPTGGFEQFLTWSYQKIVPEDRLEFVQHFADQDGTPIDPASVGMPPGIPQQVPHVLTFARASGGGTDFTVTEHGYSAPDVVELSRAGMDQCLDKLAALLVRKASLACVSPRPQRRRRPPGKLGGPSANVEVVT